MKEPRGRWRKLKANKPTNHSLPPETQSGCKQPVPPAAVTSSSLPPERTQFLSQLEGNAERLVSCLFGVLLPSPHLRRVFILFPFSYILSLCFLPPHLLHLFKNIRSSIQTSFTDECHLEDGQFLYQMNIVLHNQFSWKINSCLVAHCRLWEIEIVLKSASFPTEKPQKLGKTENKWTSEQVNGGVHSILNISTLFSKYAKSEKLWSPWLIFPLLGKYHTSERSHGLILCASCKSKSFSKFALMVHPLWTQDQAINFQGPLSDGGPRQFLAWPFLLQTNLALTPPPDVRGLWGPQAKGAWRFLQFPGAPFRWGVVPRQFLAWGPFLLQTNLTPLTTPLHRGRLSRSAATGREDEDYRSQGQQIQTTIHIHINRQFSLHSTQPACVWTLRGNTAALCRPKYEALTTWRPKLYTIVTITSELGCWLKTELSLVRLRSDPHEL